MAAPSVSNSITDLFASRAGQGSLVDIHPTTTFNSDGVIGFGNGGWYIRGTTYGAGDGNAYGGLYVELDTAQSFGTDAYLAMTLRPINTNPAFSQTTGAGWGFLSPDGGGGYDEVAFSIAGPEPGTNSEKYISLINPTKTTDRWADDAGFDETNVTHLFLAGYRYAAFSNGGFIGSATNANELLRVTPLVLTGGEVGNEATFTDYTDWLDANWPLRQFHTSPTDSMHYVNFPYRIEADEYFVENQVIQFHLPIDMSVNFPANHLNDGDIGHWVNNLVGKAVRHKNVLFLTKQAHRWWSKGAPMSGIANDTLTVIGFGDVEIADGHVTSSCSFSDCGMVKTNAPSLINTSIVDPKDAVTLDIVSADNTQNVNLKNGANGTTGVRFDFDESASTTMPGWTFEGYTNDVEYTGSGTLTITATNGTVINSTLASGSGSIVVQGAIIQQGLSFAGLQSGSQVIIYEAGTTNIIAIVESSGTTFEWIETYSVDRDVDYTITQEGFKIIRVTGVSLSDSVVPVAVQQVADRPYAPSTGLTFGVNLSVNTGTKRLDLTTVSTGQNAASALVEFWRAETALRNVQFPIADNGPDSFTLEEGWEWTPSSLPYLREDGWRYRDSDLNVTAVYANVSTNGVPAGVECEYQQVLGGTPSKAANTGDMDQLVQVFGDATHGDFDYRDYLVVKAQPNGYMEASVDVVALNGTLEDARYSIVLLPEEIPDFTTGDPGITGVTITDHGASPVTWNGKQFSVTITDTGGNTGEAIKRWLNYNKSLEAPFQSFEPFNLFDMVTGEYETMRGHIINSPGASQKGVRVVDGSGEPHPFFSRFQSDDGTYYVPPQSITFSAPNLTVGRVFLYNVTQATTMDNSLMTNGYNFGWVNGEDADEGDELLFVWASDLGDKDAIVKVLSAPGAGSISVIDAPVDDQVFNTYVQATGVGGADITEFIPDFPNLQIDLSAGPTFMGMRLYIFYKWILSSEEGIQLLVGAIRPIDAGNLIIDVNKVDFRLDSLVNQNCRQADAIIISRSDGQPVPVDQPTGGYGITMNSGKAVVFSTSEGLSAEDKALMQAIANNQFTTAQLQTGLATYDVATVDDLSGIGGGGGGLDEAGMHTALDNYTNKDGYQADLSAVLSAIAALPADTKADIADAVLGRNLGGGSNGGRTVRDALRANRNRVTVDDQAGEITVYEEDDTTVAWSGTVTTSERDPISSVDPA